MQAIVLKGHEFTRANQAIKSYGVLTPAGWFFGNFTPLNEFFRSLFSPC